MKLVFYTFYSIGHETRTTEFSAKQIHKVRSVIPLNKVEIVFLWRYVMERQAHTQTAWTLPLFDTIGTIIYNIYDSFIVGVQREIGDQRKNLTNLNSTTLATTLVSKHNLD